MATRTGLYERWLIVAGVATMLSACGGANDDLRAYIDEVKARPGGRIEPLPQVQPAPTFVYEAGNRRSPFQPDAPQRRIRLSAADLDQANDPLSVDGVLWSCNLPVADSATIGSETTIAVESVAAFDLLGLNELESEGEDGVVAISEAPPFSRWVVAPAMVWIASPTDSAGMLPISVEDSASTIAVWSRLVRIEVWIVSRRPVMTMSSSAGAVA